MSIFNLQLTDIDSNPVSLSQYEGKVLLIVNTASKCGFTPQYEGLQKLYDKYRDQGFEILGFPSNQFKEQEPGDAEEVKSFCSLNYGVTFPLFEKTDVRGADAHPLFVHLTEKAPFNGFDDNHPTSKVLKEITENNYPEFLNDDSIKWNFTKFLVDKTGTVIKRFESIDAPVDLESEIEGLL